MYQANQKKLSELARKENFLQSSLHALEVQQDELEDLNRQQEFAESENRRLRQHVTNLCDDLTITAYVL